MARTLPLLVVALNANGCVAKSASIPPMAVSTWNSSTPRPVALTSPLVVLTVRTPLEMDTARTSPAVVRMTSGRPGGTCKVVATPQPGLSQAWHTLTILISSSRRPTW